MSEVKKIVELPEHLRPAGSQDVPRSLGRQVISRPLRDGAFGVPVTEAAVPLEPNEAEEI